MIIKSNHNTNLRADPDNGVNLTTNREEWERWTIENKGDYFYIKSHHGTDLRADPDGRVSLTTNREEWERWTLEREENYFYIKSCYGTYLRADPDKTVNLSTNRMEWERWTLEWDDRTFKFFTITNNGFLNYTLNCLKSLEKLNLQNKLESYTIDNST